MHQRVSLPAAETTTSLEIDNEETLDSQPAILGLSLRSHAMTIYKSRERGREDMRINRGEKGPSAVR